MKPELQFFKAKFLISQAVAFFSFKASIHSEVDQRSLANGGNSD